MKGNEQEGFVAKYSNGLRVKIKCEDYIRLHKLLNGITPRNIFESLVSGQRLSQTLVNQIPDESYNEVVEFEQKLLAKYDEIYKIAKDTYEKVKSIGDRKTIAVKISNHPYKSIIFAMLSKKSYEHIIWKRVEKEIKEV